MPKFVKESGHKIFTSVNLCFYQFFNFMLIYDIYLISGGSVAGWKRGWKVADQAVERVDKSGYLPVLWWSWWPGPVFQVQNAGNFLIRSADQCFSLQVMLQRHPVRSLQLSLHFVTWNIIAFPYFCRYCSFLELNGAVCVRQLCSHSSLSSW